MVTSRRNLSQHLFKCHQTKTIGKCWNKIFKIFKNVMTLFFKKKAWSRQSNIPFSYLYFHTCAKFCTKKKHSSCQVFLNVFNDMSHFGKTPKCFVYDNGYFTHYVERRLRIQFSKFWISDKVSWSQGYGLEGGGENKTSKDECELFYNKIQMNHLTSFQG